MSTNGRLLSFQVLVEEENPSMKNQELTATPTLQVIDSSYGQNHLQHARRTSGERISFLLMEFSKFIRYGK
jgi:hypothetical protein